MIQLELPESRKFLQTQAPVACQTCGTILLQYFVGTPVKKTWVVEVRKGLNMDILRSK